MTAEEMTRFALLRAHERNADEIRTVLAEPKVSSLWELDKLETTRVDQPAWISYQAVVNDETVSDAAKKEALIAYATATMTNIVSIMGWFWAETIADWDGGDAFLDEFQRCAIEEMTARLGHVHIKMWYHYIKSKRAGNEAGPF